MYRHPVEVEIEALLHEGGRWRELDVREIPIGESACQPRERRIGAGRLSAQPLQHARRFERERCGTRTMADDLRAGEQLIAPAVIAVVVRVDDAPGALRC